MKKTINPAIKADIPLSFFERKAYLVAPDLLGKLLVIATDAGIRALYLTEVEAYDGFKDKASHANKGKTERNELMFGPAGYYYIYLCYGMYWMLNIVTASVNYPSAILIRATDMIQGPGRLTRDLSINKETYHGLAAVRQSGLWFADPETKYSRTKIKKSPRIGIDYAGEVWKNKLWRFYL